MKLSKKTHLITLLAILCMGVGLSAARLRLPAFTQEAAPVQIQAAPVPAGGDVSGDPLNSDRTVSLQTDKADYAPGEAIIVTGSGWDPGEVVTLVLHAEATVEAEPGVRPDRSVSVIADSAGNIWDNQLRQGAPNRGVMLQLTATGRGSGLSTQVAFANPSANLDQWADLIAPGSWVNGNLGASKAIYFEGDSIPYVLGFGSLSTSGSHTVTIEWDTTKSGKHALDYLTTYNASFPPRPNPPNPCLVASPCGSPTPFAIPADPQVTGAGVTPLAGNFTIYGGTITSVSAYSYALGTGFTGDKSARITITFTASQANPVLAWGGHISTRLDWGALSSAVAIPGSPYHTRLIDLDGAGGNQDRSLSADSVIFPGSLTIVKDAQPNGSTSFPFTASPSPLQAFSLKDDGTSANTIVFSNITTFQNYTATETTPLPTGWNFSSISCSVTSPNGGGYSTNSTAVTVTLKEGENWTCTYVNVQVPKLTVNKVCSPTTDTGKFNLQIDSVTQTANAACGTGTGAVTTTVGSHTVSETAGTGTSLGDYTTVISGDCGADGSVSLAYGDSKTCTITNTRKPKLTVNKVCSPTTDTGKFNLRIDGSTAGTGADAVCGTGTTGAMIVSIGSHTVSETAGTGTSLGDYTTVIGGACAADGTVSLLAGDNKTCTITNTRSATLTVNKACSPTTDTGKFNLRIDGSTAGTGADAVCGTGTTGAVIVSIGSHTVSETAGTGTSLGDYTTVIGGACAADGTVSLLAGDNKTCTITNTRSATLTVNKACSPTTDTGKFNLRIDGSTAGTGADAVCGTGTTGAVIVSIGSHTVSETAGTGTSLGDYTTVIGGACAADGTVSLLAGDNKTCTITNTKQPTLTVNKACSPTTDTGKFNLRIDGSTAGTGADAVCGTGTTGAVIVSIGSHTVSETAGTGTSLGDYTTVIGGACAADGTVSLLAGDNKTCTITNTKQATLTVNKACVPTTDTGKFNLQIDASTAGTGADAVCGTGTTGAVVLAFGSHTVGETAGTGTSLTDYTTPAIGGDCDPDGSVTLAAGDHKVCTITNTHKNSPAESTAQNLLPNDSLTLTGATSKAGGNITFSLFDPSDPTCSGTPALSQTVSVSGNGTYITTNTTFLASASGTWRWLVSYSGDGNNEPVTSACGTEQFTIQNDPASRVAGQLLAAHLSWAGGAEACSAATDAMNAARDLLATIHFNGVTHDKMTDAQNKQATDLTVTLERFTKNDLCK